MRGWIPERIASATLRVAWEGLPSMSNLDPSTDASDSRSVPPLWQVALLSALAGGMGWGIRGQYGHQTGAMMAGLLVALVLVTLLPAGFRSVDAARAVAFGAIGVAFGGSMTYGQTIGLTQDKELIGNWSALAWGMTGLFVKGALWIGLFGAFLGMGLSRVRYRVQEVALLFMVLVGLMFAGIFLFNQPYDLETRRLPAIYFSMTWEWMPNKADLKPRFENWGGLLLGLIAVTAYASRQRGDRLARNLALFGVLFGGLGFAGGQCFQACHAWNLESYRQGWFASIDPLMNWWNVMEITFGLVMGGGLGLGAWLNRGLIGPKTEAEETLSPGVEALFLGMHPLMLLGWEFLELGPLSDYCDLAFTVWTVPAVAVVAGRRFPYALALPWVGLPIAGKTLRQLSYKTELVPILPGWLLFVALPLAALGWVAWRSIRRSEQEDGQAFARRALVAAAWTYYLLNYGFFEFPWPWLPPTGRTPSAIMFTLCVLALTAAALRRPSRGTSEGRLSHAAPPGSG